MDILQLREQQRIEKNGDGEEECQKPALQQKTTDNNDDDDDDDKKACERENQLCLPQFSILQKTMSQIQLVKTAQHITSIF